MIYHSLRMGIMGVPYSQTWEIPTCPRRRPACEVDVAIQAPHEVVLRLPRVLETEPGPNQTRPRSPGPPDFFVPKCLVVVDVCWIGFQMEVFHWPRMTQRWIWNHSPNSTVILKTGPQWSAWLYGLSQWSLSRSCMWVGHKAGHPWVSHITPLAV